MNAPVAPHAATTPRTARGGLAVLLAGVVLIIAAIGSAATEWAWIGILLAFLGLAYGVPLLHELQAPADGAAGKWGARLVRLGASVLVLLGLVFLAWEAVGDPPEDGPAVVGLAWMLGFAAVVLGMVLFAVSIIRAKVLPAPAGVLILVGLIAALAIDMATGAFFDDGSEATEWGFYLGIPVFGLGLAWAGYDAWRRRSVAHPGARTAV